MRIFGRRKTWRRVVGKTAVKAVKNPAVKTGAAALTGIVTAVAASAAVSAARRKSDS